MAVRLSAYLERKLLERMNELGDPRYSVTQYAEDIGIMPDTLSAIMNKPVAKSIAWDTLRAFIEYFGDEFLKEFDLEPPEIPKSQQKPREPA